MRAATMATGFDGEQPSIDAGCLCNSLPYAVSPVNWMTPRSQSIPKVRRHNGRGDAARRAEQR